MSDLEWIYGIHAVENALTQQPERIKEVRFQEGRDDKKTQRLIQLCKNSESAPQCGGSSRPRSIIYGH